MSKKFSFLLLILVIFVAFVVYQLFFTKTGPNFTLAEVVRDNISQEVSASGAVEQGEEIDLAFKNSGGIEKILVKVGDEIKAGQVLVNLDTKELLLQLKEAEASLQITQAEATKSEENLANAYQDGLNALDDAYLKIYNAYATTNLIKRTYFERGDSESIVVADNKYRIEKALEQLKFYTDSAKNSLKNEDIDTALSQAIGALSTTRNSLEVIRSTMETSVYKDIVSSTDKASLDTQRLNINTSYDNIISSQQNISMIKIDNAMSINAAQSKVSEIGSQSQEAQGGLYQAKIKQAEANVELLKHQIEASALKSPTDGQIIEVEIQEGEIVQPGQVVISMIPDSPFQIKVDVYEEDVVKMAVGNSVDIALTALPNEIFKGRVILINPAEKIKEGVVYYETTIDFENSPEKIKPGMTADLTIKTMTKENVLVIPEAAVTESSGQATVQVLNGKKIDTRQIEIGMKGSNDLVEVVSGLKEGEEVAIKD